MPTPPIEISKAAAEWATVMAVSPIVIGARLSQFWLSFGHPTKSDGNEAQRMVIEKMAATGESLMAMNLAMIDATVAASTALLTGQSRHVDDADAILTAGLKPYTKRLKANRQRLDRRG